MRAAEDLRQGGAAAGTAADLSECGVGPEAGFGTDLLWTFPVAFRLFGQWAHAAVADLPGGPRGYLILATIARGLPRSQLALANQLGVDRTGMTYLLDELESARFVERRPDPTDRRARQVLITTEGTTALEEYRARLQSVVEAFLAPLTPPEAVEFQAMLERIVRGAQQPPGECGETDAPPLPDR